MNTNNKNNPTHQEIVFGNYLSYLASPCNWREGRSVASGKTQRNMRQAQDLYKTTKSVWDEFLSQDPDNIFVWSDLHIDHAKIIEYANRVFCDVNVMNDAMLANARDVLSDDDWVLFGGDVSLKSPEMMRSWLKRCPGKKVLILGNHDVKTKDLSAWLDAGFSAIAPCVTYNHESLDFELWITHYPMEDHLDADVYNLHGHTHDNPSTLPMISMCVEHLNYTPTKLLDLLIKQSAV